jgi:hypothetical protein
VKVAGSGEKGREGKGNKQNDFFLKFFSQTYRSIIPFDGSDSPAPQSILTVDLGAGTGYVSPQQKRRGEGRNNAKGHIKKQHSDVFAVPSHLKTNKIPVKIASV